jgi:serine/threonine protein kinase
MVYALLKRGLKPVLVLYSLVNEAWKVTDFAFTMEGSSRRAYTTVYSRGTRSYRAPELIRPSQLKYNNKVDIWAIGCILYELVLRQKAFEDDWEVLQCATSGKDIDIVIEPDTVPDDRRRQFISNIIKELLSVDPSRRPRADILYERFISWGSDISASQADPTIDLVQSTANAFDMTTPTSFASAINAPNDSPAATSATPTHPAPRRASHTEL